MYDINEGSLKIDGIDIKKMFITMNKRIEYLFDREHTLGHAFFLPLLKDPKITTLASIFQNAIIPLLQEYFYEDYSKIQLVLGDNGKIESKYKFILDDVLATNTVFKGILDIDLPEMVYSIQTDAFYEAESYRQIY